MIASNVLHFPGPDERQLEARQRALAHDLACARLSAETDPYFHACGALQDLHTLGEIVADAMRMFAKQAAVSISAMEQLSEDDQHNVAEMFGTRDIARGLLLLRSFERIEAAVIPDEFLKLLRAERA